MQSFDVCVLSFWSTLLFLNVECQSLDRSTSSPKTKDIQQNPAEDQGSKANRIHPPFATSPIYLTNLAQTEQLIFEIMVAYEQQLLERLKILQRYRSDYEESVGQALTQSGAIYIQDRWTKAAIVSSNPFLSYRMMHRFVKDLNQFTEHIWKSLENDLWQRLETLRGEFDWPSENDLLASAKSLIKLQDTYDFNSLWLNDGAFRDYAVRVGIAPKHSLEIARTALTLKDITAATDFYQAAHAKVIHGTNMGVYQPNSVSMDDLTQAWNLIYKEFQNVWPMTAFRTHDVFSEAKAYLREEFNKTRTHLTYQNRFVNFKALCRGEILKSSAEIAKLTCFYDRNFHPYLYLNPLAVEIHNWEPLVYQIHQFLGIKTLQEINLNAVSSMVRSIESRVDISTAQPDVKSYTQTMLFEEYIPELHKLTDKLSRLTGLTDTISSLNSYHISAFAVGAQYGLCTDCFDFNKNTSNDHQVKTKTTVHAVLYQPDLGGELAFTLLGILVKPVVGSLIIYNNINPVTQQPDDRVLHGSCPVVIGQKWIATKLISVK